MDVDIPEDETIMVRKLIKENIGALLLTNAKKAVSERFFVTQINEKIDEEEEYIDTRFSRIDSSKTISIPKSGIQKHGADLKLQRNILAKIIVDEKEVTKDLALKRLEFEDRINKCKEKQGQLQIKQEHNRSVVAQYSQFINEKEIIRKKAVAKYQTELKNRLQKMLECDVLVQQLDKVKLKHQELTRTVKKNKKYKDFLTVAIEMLPDNYLEAGESKYVSLMMRHQTLYESNFDLFENLIANSDKLKVLRLEYERLVLEHNSNIMTVSSKLGELQKIKDQINIRNARNEEAYYRDGDKRREDVIELSNIFSGIDNLAEKCRDPYRLNQPTIESMNNFQKLDLIKNYILKQLDIIKIINSNS